MKTRSRSRSRGVAPVTFASGKQGSAKRSRARPATRVHVGTAGWSYRDWEGVLYPKPHPRGFDPLSFLAQYVDVVEVNSTFYGPADSSVAARWADRVAEFEHFSFTAKLWRRFTHERDTAFTRADVSAVHSGM